MDCGGVMHDRQISELRNTWAAPTAKVLGIALAISLALPSLSQAQSLLSTSKPARSYLLAQNDSWHPRDGVLLAQADGDDAYDPFADYSEFEESMDEEEDINFFRNGRLLTMGFLLGYRSWTGTLAKIYSGSPGFGLFLSYFFDLRFALQFGYLTSDHSIAVPSTANSAAIQGSIGITDISVAMKYYFNTQNVTRGLAEMNPYMIVGFSQIYRTFSVSGNDKASKDSAFGFDVGGGIEIPLMRNKMYFGAQVMYQLVNFPDEGREMQDSNDKLTGVTPRGDTWNFLGVLGTNF